MICKAISLKVKNLILSFIFQQLSEYPLWRCVSLNIQYPRTVFNPFIAQFQFYFAPQKHIWLCSTKNRKDWADLIKIDMILIVAHRGRYLLVVNSFIWQRPIHIQSNRLCWVEKLIQRQDPGQSGQPLKNFQVNSDMDLLAVSFGESIIICCSKQIIIAIQRLFNFIHSKNIF